MPIKIPQLTYHSFRLAAFFCLWLAAGCASQPVSNMPRGATAIYGNTEMISPHNIYHVVGPSETLWRISKTYGIDMDTLMKANGLNDASKLKNGQRLLIPHSSGPRPYFPLFPTKKWTYIVIHHTATDTGDAYAIDQLHHRRGFENGLGYHFLINNGTNGMADGQIQVGPRWIKQMDGAHANADGMNEKGIGVVVVGNFSARPITNKEYEALVFLVKTLKDFYHIPAGHVIRHSDVLGKNTECPGLKFPWNDFKRRIS